MSRAETVMVKCCARAVDAVCNGKSLPRERTYQATKGKKIPALAQTRLLVVIRREMILIITACTAEY
jgi:hypothetical protein